MAHPLLDNLEALAARLRRRATAELSCWVAAAVLGLGCALMLADYALRPSDPGLRWLFSGGVVAAGLAAAGLALHRLADLRVTTMAVAHRLQERHPALGSRLASAVEFAGQPEDDPTAGSADLRRAVVLGADADLARTDLGAAVDPAPLRRAGGAAAACLGAIALFAVADHGGLSAAAARLLLPWRDAPWPRVHHLEALAPPTRVARGQAFEVTVVDRNGALPADARIAYRTPMGGQTQLEEQPLRAAGDRGTATRENVQRAFEFRVFGGDDHQMPWTRVEVVDPPAARRFACRVVAPPYAGLPDAPLADRVRALAGSTVRLEGEGAGPLRSAAMERTTDGPPDRFEADLGGEANTFVIADDRLTLEATDRPTTATLRLRLEDPAGLVGLGDPHAVVIEPDPAPRVEWVAPAGEQYLPPGGVVSVRALVEDNLAVSSATLAWEAQGQEAAPADDPDPTPPAQPAPPADPAAGGQAAAPAGRVPLYQGPDSPPRREAATFDGVADSFEASAELELEPLNLRAGDYLSLVVEAVDYRPGVGRTPLPRRVAIVSPEEFDARLAEEQADLLRGLERLLTEQRGASQGVEALRIERASGVEVNRGTVDRLAGAGLGQRRVAEGIDEPHNGALAEARRLRGALEASRLDRPEVKSLLDALAGRLAGLAEGALPEADRAITDARRAGERALEPTPTDAAEQLADALARARAAQSTAQNELEALVAELADRANYERFAQQVAELEQTLRALSRQTAEGALRAAGAPADAPQARAERGRLAAEQGEVNRRVEKLLAEMRRHARDRAAGEPDNGDGQGPTGAEAVEDALATADERGVAGKLAEAASRLAQGQLGRAVTPQQGAADDLRNVLEALRDRAPSDPSELARRLREAARELAALREEQSRLRAERDAARPEDQQRLAEQAERMGRKLDRLSAQSAGESSGQAAESMNQAAAEQQQGREPQADARRREAEDQLAEAQRRAEQRARELENQVAERLLDRLEAQIDGLITRQRGVLERTLRADVLRSSRAPSPQAAPIAEDQLALRGDVLAAADVVAERQVFDLALRGAAEDMRLAGSLLGAGDVGRDAQRLEHSAVTRLTHVRDALKSRPEPTDPPANSPPPGGAPGQPGAPPPPSPVDVAELKLLRLMQLELNAQTKLYEADAADAGPDVGAPAPPKEDLAPRGERLAEEQRRLADLVRELLERNNEPQAPGVAPGGGPPRGEDDPI